MESINLAQVHNELLEIKDDIEDIKHLLTEEYPLADDLVTEIQASRRRPKSDFISHEEMKNEFV